MSQEPPFIESRFAKPDVPFETSLRPSHLDEFIGQEAIKKRLHILIQAALERGESLGHILFSGPPGLGKTTLAHIVAKMMGGQLTLTSGPAIERPGDLAGLLTNLKQGDFLFIDEIHRLSKITEEYLYSAMEDFSLDLIIDSGPNARSVQVKLQPFTLLGATTRSGLLSAPLRSRFAHTLRLDYYPPEVLGTILSRTAQLLSFAIEPKATFVIAQRARGTPRVANNLIRWVRDVTQTEKKEMADLYLVEKALGMLSIDRLGLDEIDTKILTLLIDHYEGRPVGLNHLAAAIGEEPHTIEEVHEPFLILQGFLQRTPRGRIATALAYEHFGRTARTFNLPLEPS